MDILHEMNQLEMGGIERVIVNLAKYDKENKHTVLAYRDGPMREELERAGAKVSVCLEGDAEVSFNADIIHIHCGGSQSHLAPSIHEGFTIVETIHSPVKSPNRKEWLAARVGVSNVVSGINPGAITIHNGIDIPAMEPIRPAGWLRKQIRSDRPIVGRIGRIGPDKCMEDFLLACELAQRQIDFDVVIAGPEAFGAPGYLGKCLLMADSLPVRNCHFIGAQRCADFMNEIDVFMYPSPTEGFGLVFAEAMLFDKPIVTWKTAAAQEVCAGHAVLTDDNVPALAYGLLDVLQQPSLRDALVDGSSDVVKEFFSADRMAANYQEFYRSLNAKSAVPADTESLSKSIAAS